VGRHMVQTGNLLPKKGFVGCYIVQTGNLLPKIEVLWGVIWYRLVIC